MTATAERSPLVAFAYKMLPRFASVASDTHDPIVLILLNRWRRQSGLPPGPMLADGAAWRAITFDDKVVLVYGERWTNRSVLVTNICPAASRYGTLAVYALLVLYRQGYEAGMITGFVAPVLHKNVAMIRALSRVYGDIAPVDSARLLVPHAYVYALGEVT